MKCLVVGGIAALLTFLANGRTFSISSLCRAKVLHTVPACCNRCYSVAHVCLSTRLIDCLVLQVASVVPVMRGRAGGGVSPKPLQAMLLVMPLQVALVALIQVLSWSVA